MQDRVFISIETTGINTSTDKIVEIAALKIDKNNLKSLFHQIINPEKEIDKNISNIIGYSNEELKKYPKINEINESFINFINSSTLIGHNNDFIFNFLNSLINSLPKSSSPKQPIKAAGTLSFRNAHTTLAGAPPR